MKTITVSLAVAAAVLGAALPAWGQDPAAPPASRRAFFGELHLHTAMSFDAWTFGTKLVADQAYKFGRGDTVVVPGAQLGRQQGLDPSKDVAVKRAWPLDFMAVTDHSEYIGAAHELDKPDSAFSKTAVGQEIARLGQKAFQQIARFQKDPAVAAAAVAADGWNVQMKAANDNYVPGKFTTLIAYEWTAGQGGRHLHRNVIFNGDHAPAPFTAVQSKKPEDLWTYLEATRKTGLDVIAISHNSNLSDGLTYDFNDSYGKPIDAEYALRKALNEPLSEIAQTKGSSDTRPELSPNDEFANFEILDRVFGDETKAATGGGYIRDAYGRGLIIQSKVGVNPFKMGLVGGTDIHNGLTNSDENTYAGGPRSMDPHAILPSQASVKEMFDHAAQSKGLAPKGEGGGNPLANSSGGLTGVWAEKNDRASIFAALKRKETFGTSGVRIRLRMFSGWGFDPKMMASPGWVKTAYATGVAMGSDLPARPAKASAPKLALWAVKDPDGANLDRIQVIKVWLDGGAYKEKVFDAALSGGRKVNPKTGKAPAVGNTVNLKTGAVANTIGAAELKTVWTDPEFDAAKPAVYYTRVLQIPTPRWTTLLAIAEHLPLPPSWPATIQERGWSSPVWYTPPKS